MSTYTDVTRTIVEKLVSQPDKLEIEEQDEDRRKVVLIKVAPEDMGKVIGKEGRNIDSIRAVVRAAGLRQHERVQVELYEPEDEQSEQPPRDAVPVSE
jgi:predicted RNA-binding protein YlqC (UPF0109 family)